MGKQMGEEPTPEFAEWAASFSGCDGGNPHGDIWVCGLEHGGEAGNPCKRMAGGPIYEPPLGYDRPECNLDYPYNQNLLRIFCGIYGQPPSAYAEFNQKHNPFVGKGQNFFKINLFPLKFPNNENYLWESGHTECTGFTNKKSYTRWCLTHRLEFLRDQIHTYQPKVIIGVGTGHRGGFKRLLSENPRNVPLSKEVATVAKWKNGEKHKEVEYSDPNDHTVLAVIPFPGKPSGPQSNDEMEKFGRKIAEIVPSLREGPATAQN